MAGYTLLVKREDLNHPHVSGNKWWKLNGNIGEALSLNASPLITFGGAYSNHLVATAAAAREAGLQSLGIIRGEKVTPLNTSLTFAERMGMELRFVSREKYREKIDQQFLENLRREFPGSYLIPEGGTNALAVHGVARFARKLKSEIEFDEVCLAVGTGGTMTGMIIGMEGEKRITGIAVLKGDFLYDEVSTLLKRYAPGKQFMNWRIKEGYHFGGYAKSNSELDEFISDRWRNSQLPLEPVYTGKLFYGVYDMIRRKQFSSPSRILVIHSGGLESMRQLPEQ